MKVLPNFCTSINDVLDSAKPWIAKYEISIRGHENDGVSLERLAGGYVQGHAAAHQGAGAEPWLPSAASSSTQTSAASPPTP